MYGAVVDDDDDGDEQSNVSSWSLAAQQQRSNECGKSEMLIRSRHGAT